MADQSKRVIFQTDDGGVGIIVPAKDCDCDLTIEQIAVKDVPPKQVWAGAGVFDIDPDTGKAIEQGQWVKIPRPYKIINVSDLPPDRSERDLWAVDETDLTDGVGGLGE